MLPNEPSAIFRNPTVKACKSGLLKTTAWLTHGRGFRLSVPGMNFSSLLTSWRGSGLCRRPLPLLLTEEAEHRGGEGEGWRASWRRQPRAQLSQEGGTWASVGEGECAEPKPPFCRIKARVLGAFRAQQSTHFPRQKLLRPPPGSLPGALAHTVHKSTLLFLVLTGSPGRGAKSHRGLSGPLRVVASGNPRAAQVAERGAVLSDMSEGP